MKSANRMQVNYVLKRPVMMRKYSLLKGFTALSYKSLRKHRGESVP